MRLHKKKVANRCRYKYLSRTFNSGCKTVSRYTKLTAVVIPLILLFFGYNRWVFSLDLFRLYSDPQYSQSRHEDVKNFNPDRDSLYLPGMEDKEFFESVNDFSIMRKKGVREFIYIYLTTGREYTVRSIERSGLYMDTIDRIMKKNPDIPAEIAILPLLESGFDPVAVSRSGAVGLWQFMAGTSSPLGLKTDSMIDERCHIEKSTEAALRHLRYLYRKFGSWELALAAYNGGEGQLSRAMEKAGTCNIWALIDSGFLSRETAEYVPRYAALTLIYRNISLFRLDKELNMESMPDTDEIRIDEQRTLSDISLHYGTDPGTLKRLNPELKTGIVPGSANGYTLKIPSLSSGSMIAKMIF